MYRFDSNVVKKVKHNYISATRIVGRNACPLLVEKPDLHKLQSLQETFENNKLEANIKETKRNEIFEKKVFPPSFKIGSRTVNYRQAVQYLANVMLLGSKCELIVVQPDKLKDKLSKDNQVAVAGPSHQDTEVEEGKFKITRLIIGANQNETTLSPSTSPSPDDEEK